MKYCEPPELEMREWFCDECLDKMIDQYSEKENATKNNGKIHSNYNPEEE
jgi:hypothetical protein